METVDNKFDPTAEELLSAVVSENTQLRIQALAQQHKIQKLEQFVTALEGVTGLDDNLAEEEDDA